MSAPQSQADLVLNAALELLDQGFSVIPVGRNKRPLFAWKEFQARQPSEDELLAWWADYPQANLALITGSVSGVWVVDADGPQGAEWISKNLPRTSVYAKTAKGLHAYFKIPEGVSVQNMVRLAPEVDVRGEGGYVVVPPSIHDTGVIYEWEFTEGFDGWEDLTEIAPPGAEVPRKAGNLQLDLSRVQLPPSVEPVSEGERNNALARLVGRWVAKDLDYDEVSLFAKAWNAKNEPPLPELELKRTVKSVWELHQRNHPEPKSSDAYVPEREEAIVPPEVLQPGGLLQEI